MNNSIDSSPGQTEIVIIIGAGASGLMAARELSAAGAQVILLEAADEPGGRIRTFQEKGFMQPVEAGAEFVHGDLPLTLQLLRSAGIPIHPVKGKMVNVSKGKWLGKRESPEGWGSLMESMQQLVEDMPLSDFLSTYFPDERYAGLRDSVRRYAEGFDLADIHRVSTRALYAEWSQEGDGQYRIEGGYGRLIAWLAQECRMKGCVLQLSCPVEKIIWEKGRVIVSTAGGQVFTGTKAILTVSLGILQASLGAQQARSGQTSQPCAIYFSPSIDDRLKTAGLIGYGTVVKILLQFSTAFWNGKDKNIGFIISDEPIPTWWTQFPDTNPLLTGWAPGEPANSRASKEEKRDGLTELSLSSLARIFGQDKAVLKQQLTGARIVDWFDEPYTRGGYSFETLESPAARRLLNQPLQDTLYFAGEALHEGDAPGTVEAAFDSGKKVADKITNAALS